MAIAGLHLNLLELTQRQAELQDEITHLQSQKNISLFSQKDNSTLQYHEVSDARRFYKEMLANDVDLQEEYNSYEDMPEYKEMIDMINAKYQEQLEEITAWETIIDNQITTASAELEEVKAWEESYRTMLTSNIQSDFNFGLNQ